MHDPQTIAHSMTLARGREEAALRCDKYISGLIRSEQSQKFWTEVKAAIAQVPA